jgi:pyruvate decarboxylase
MPRTIPLAQYLFARLRQLNVNHVYGVPGDFTLKALDHLPPSGLRWVGCCNELNAGYAADGYARIRGASALFTTYGVGELSAINAVAGSYAEHVPVVHIVGTPQFELQNSKLQVHHTLGDGRFRVFKECAEKFSVAQANLIDAEKAPQMIDETIERGLLESRPVYIELPCDMVTKDVSVERLETYRLKDRVTSVASIEKETVDWLLERLYNAKQPLLLVDRGDGVQHHIQDEIVEFVKKSAIPTLVMPSGNGMIPHSIPNFYGVHSGPVGQIDTLPFVQSADLVINFGPMFSDTQTLGFKVVPDPAKSITVCKSSITDGMSGRTTAIESKSFMRNILASMNAGRIQHQRETSSLGNFRTISPRDDKANEMDSPIDQNTLYLRLSPYLRPHDIVLLGNATPILGGRDFVLPPHASVIASGMWFSIGHMLPAALGAATAQQQSHEARASKKRTVLVDGDGNIQITVQEISTVLREKLNVTIFVINNGGYAYERQIHGMNEGYNDLHPWRYVDAPKFFGSDEVQGEDYCVKSFRIKTWRDLKLFLEEEKQDMRRGFRMVEIMVGKYDVPDKFKTIFKAAAARL